jgi:Terminase large subunit, T4likevirus-type, N-terminal
VMGRAGLTPDPWQQAVLRSASSRVLLLCTRQAGKSTTAAALALNEALLRPRSLVLLLSPSERQSGELATKVFTFYDALGQPVPARKRTELQLHLGNGSRIIALPENERTIRGYSGAKLLIVDEASRVSDGLYYAVRPMLAVSRGRLLALSTPYGKRGWYFDEWDRGAGWERLKITADLCPRIPASFLAEERRSLGPRWFAQEYMCSFEDAIDAVFSHGDIQAALSGDVEPLFPG